MSAPDAYESAASAAPGAEPSRAPAVAVAVEPTGAASPDTPGQEKTQTGENDT